MSYLAVERAHAVLDDQEEEVETQDLALKRRFRYTRTKYIYKYNINNIISKLV